MSRVDWSRPASGKEVWPWDAPNEALGMTGPGGLKGPSPLVQHAFDSMVMDFVQGDHGNTAMSLARHSPCTSWRVLQIRK